MRPDKRPPTPDAQLRACLAKFGAEQQKLFRAVRTTLRKRFPSANELAYDYGKALVVAYAPGDRGIDAVVALRASVAGVSLYFNQAPRLHDPKRLLRGTGKQARFIELESARQLADPDVDRLIAAAVAQAKHPLPVTGRGRLVFKSDGAKKRR